MSPRSDRRIGWGYGYGAGFVDGKRGRYNPTPPKDGRTRPQPPRTLTIPADPNPFPRFRLWGSR